MIRVTGADGLPVAGASVTMGSTELLTDSDGVVAIPYAPNKADTGTTTFRVYNRLRYRAIQAKVNSAVRAMPTPATRSARRSGWTSSASRRR